MDIKQELVNRAEELIVSDKIEKEFILGNSGSKTTFNRIKAYLTIKNKTGASLAILHPPYHDIIKFSDKKEDLSNAPTNEDFLKKFKKVVENSRDLLKKDGYLAIIIGDKYTG